MTNFYLAIASVLISIVCAFIATWILGFKKRTKN